MIGIRPRLRNRMPVSEQIPRIRTDPDGLDFETLRKEGIGRIQDLCGAVWTDYNLHDPGVTILEQLCYGLTDLSYRSGFAVQDYLTDEKNNIDFQRQALFPPEEIFPSSAVTGIDYQKILYDAIPEIDYAWLEPDAAAGLYTVFVKLDDELMQHHARAQKQNGALSEQSGKLEQIHTVSERIRASLDRLGAELDEQYENLNSGRSISAAADSSTQAAGQPVDQIGGILRQLDAILASLDSIWHQIGNLWSVIMDSPSSSGLSARLNDVLRKLAVALDDALENVLPVFESAADSETARDSALPDKLVTPLSAFESALRELDAELQETANGLVSKIGAPDQAGGQWDESAVIQKVRSVFAAHRNLCEDIDQVEIIRTVPYFLAGEVEIQPAHNRAKIYAEIFLKCAHSISSGIQVDRYESILSQTGNYERIFTGPLTQHGFISDRCFAEGDEVISVVDLITMVSRIDGVIKVRDLYLIDRDNKKHTSISYDSSRHAFPGLSFPRSAKPQQILRLVLPHDVSRKDHDGQTPGFRFYENRQDEALLEETQLELRKLVFEYHAFRNNRPSFAHLIPPPKGERRVAAEYYSIQNHFPAAYGINRYGIPHSKPPEVKAKAKQLKAYLFPFEQLMADYLQHVQEMPRLFSLDAGLKQSYFSQSLDNGNIPGIEPLYVKDAHDSQAALAGILRHYDNFGDRRSRALDTLLAMYGEQYPQAALQQFDCYRRPSRNRWMIENKINFLKCIKDITRDRGKGFNYLKPALCAQHEDNEENLAGAHKRISILLGLTQFDRISLITDVLTQKNSRLIPDRIVANSMRFLPEEMEARAIPLAIDEEQFAEIAVPAKLPPFCYSVFKEGVELKNYRLVSSGKETVVCLKSASSARLWPLSRKRDRAVAARYAHEFCSALTQLNVACERFHLVEHVLLRPRGKDSFAAIPEGEAFFDFRVSVIFPSWTARFSNTAFRKFAEETVLKNLPAHIVAEFYWLDFVYLQDFEQRYKRWLFCLQQAHQAHRQNGFERLNSASEKLVSFLLRNRSGAECERWL